MKLPKPKKKCKNCSLTIDEPLKDPSKPGIGNFCSFQCFAAYSKTTAPSTKKKTKSFFDKQMEKPEFRKAFKVQQRILKKELKEFNSRIRGGVAAPKPILDRDPQYLEFVRSFPCIVCRAKNDIHAHHTETGGMGVKGSDLSSVPLCHEHHTGGDVSIHKLGVEEFEKLHGISLKLVQVELLRAYVRCLCGHSLQR